MVSDEIAPPETLSEDSCALTVADVNIYYENFQAVKNISFGIANQQITALIGPSGCGKSTLLRSFNRMNDEVEGCRITGSIKLRGEEIHRDGFDVVELRSRVGMVFQKPNPFPKSVWDNVAYGPRLHGVTNAADLAEIVERSLRSASLWDEVKDKLNERGTRLSGGQQQRLCIARAIAVSPEVILMDEPCSALDPIATARIEELMFELKQDYTIIIVTHSMQQAARTSAYTAFLYLGEMIEYGTTDKIFNHPHEKRTEDYISGRYG